MEAHVAKQKYLVLGFALDHEINGPGQPPCRTLEMVLQFEDPDVALAVAVDVEEAMLRGPEFFDFHEVQVIEKEH